MTSLLFIAALIGASWTTAAEAAVSKGSFEDNFSIMWSEDHFKTSEDGQIWYLSLDKETGTHTYTSQTAFIIQSMRNVQNLYLKQLVNLN